MTTIDTSAPSRLAIIDAVLAHPPPVHAGAEQGGAPGGVWAADRDCYEFMAGHCRADDATLETGLGVSTVLFAAWQTRHTCVVPYAVEVEASRRYCREIAVDDSGVEYLVGFSERILPTLQLDPLDLVLIDGGHGYPTAILDWYFAGGALRAGGVLVLDDINLPSVRHGLVDYLDADDRWSPLERSHKWAAWRRLSSGPLNEEWTSQPFLT